MDILLCRFFIVIEMISLGDPTGKFLEHSYADIIGGLMELSGVLVVLEN
jgi:hypothetical protein